MRHCPSEAIASVDRSEDKSFRYVHLDLKGAPPSLVYLRQLLPHLAQWGVTGLVIEYEDCFPYHGALQVLRAPHAYNVEELRAFLFDCRALRMDIIPLVQTFGHMEVSE